jgi:hypothetical protein
MAEPLSKEEKEKLRKELAALRARKARELGPRKKKMLEPIIAGLTQGVAHGYGDDLERMGDAMDGRERVADYYIKNERENPLAFRAAELVGLAGSTVGARLGLGQVGKLTRRMRKYDGGPNPIEKWMTDNPKATTYAADAAHGAITGYGGTALDQDVGLFDVERLQHAALGAGIGAASVPLAARAVNVGKPVISNLGLLAPGPNKQPLFREKRVKLDETLGDTPQARANQAVLEAVRRDQEELRRARRPLDIAPVKADTDILAEMRDRNIDSRRPNLAALYRAAASTPAGQRALEAISRRDPDGFEKLMALPRIKNDPQLAKAAADASVSRYVGETWTMPTPKPRQSKQPQTPAPVPAVVPEGAAVPLPAASPAKPRSTRSKKDLMSEAMVRGAFDPGYQDSWLAALAAKNKRGNPAISKPARAIIARGILDRARRSVQASANPAETARELADNVVKPALKKLLPDRTLNEQHVLADDLIDNARRASGRVTDPIDREYLQPTMTQDRRGLLGLGRFDGQLMRRRLTDDDAAAVMRALKGLPAQSNRVLAPERMERIDRLLVQRAFDPTPERIQRLPKEWPAWIPMTSIILSAPLTRVAELGLDGLKEEYRRETGVAPSDADVAKALIAIELADKFREAAGVGEGPPEEHQQRLAEAQRNLEAYLAEMPDEEAFRQIKKSGFDRDDL